MGILKWLKRTPQKKKRKTDLIRELPNEEIEDDSVDPFEEGIELGYERDENRTFDESVLEGDTYGSVSETEIKKGKARKTTRKARKKPVKRKTKTKAKPKKAAKRKIKKKTVRRKKRKR